jgi:lysophospholipase L1-like esterase
MTDDRALEEERRPRRWQAAALLVRQAWLAVGLTLLLLAVAEAGARLVLLARPPAVDPRVHADAYAGAPWVAGLYAEIAHVGRMRWEPYVYWRRVAFAGRFVNVDERGLRRTWQPPEAAALAGAARQEAAGVGTAGVGTAGVGTAVKPQGTVAAGAAVTPAGMAAEAGGASVGGAAPAALPRVFFLGGSAAWGSGVRDDHTIASELARWLAAHGAPALVTNYGESGYVSTQALLVLVRELQRGAVPDTVVLYGGALDVSSATAAVGRVGVPLNEGNREREFDLLRHARRLVPAALRVLAARSALVKLAGLHPLYPPPPAPPLTPALADAVAGELATNRRILAALAASYGFRLIWVWEPSILEKPRLTAYERSYFNRVPAPLRGWQPVMVGRLRREWSMSSCGGSASGDAACEVLFLDDLFAPIAAPRFIDQSHTSETANAEVAAAIGGRLLAAGCGGLRRRPATDPTVRNLCPPWRS